MSTIYNAVLNSTTYQQGKKQLLDALRHELSKITAPQPAVPHLKKKYDELIQNIETHRGRELFFKCVGSGAGFGPFLELADGSIKYDLISGIGVNFFGHGNLDLLEAQLDGIWCDVQQGNLSPNIEYAELMEALLKAVGKKSNLKHVWLTTCGATANEIALKIIRQKKYPASRVMAFKHCFAGRTTALQEITDNEKLREGQPTYNEVYHLPFFDVATQESPADQAGKVIDEMRSEIKRSPGQFACLEFEIVQGEGGFNVAPPGFLIPIIQEARSLGLAVWVDEIQTFGRTGEIFCYQRQGLDEYVDVVTVAKLLQTGAALYRAEYNPKPGLISGTFAGANSALRAGKRVLELLSTKLCGPNGRIRQLEQITNEEFKKLKNGTAGKYLKDHTVFGGMIAFTLFDGSLERTKKFLSQLWDLGAIAFYCGHEPYRVRMLPPFGIMTDQQLTHVFQLIEQAILKTAQGDSAEG